MTEKNKLVDMTGNEIRVYQYLKYGIKNRVTRDFLVSKTGISDREVRRAIHSLRDKGYPICSAVERPGGYWLCNDVDFLIWFIADLKTQRDGLSKAIRRMEKMLKDWGKKNEGMPF